MASPILNMMMQRQQPQRPRYLQDLLMRGSVPQVEDPGFNEVPVPFMPDPASRGEKLMTGAAVLAGLLSGFQQEAQRRGGSRMRYNPAAGVAGGLEGLAGGLGAIQKRKAFDTSVYQNEQGQAADQQQRTFDNAMKVRADQRAETAAGDRQDRLAPGAQVNTPNGPAFWTGTRLEMAQAQGPPDLRVTEEQLPSGMYQRRIGGAPEGSPYQGPRPEKPEKTGMGTLSAGQLVTQLDQINDAIRDGDQDVANYNTMDQANQQKKASPVDWPATRARLVSEGEMMRAELARRGITMPTGDAQAGPAMSQPEVPADTPTARGQARADRISQVIGWR